MFELLMEGLNEVLKEKKGLRKLHFDQQMLEKHTYLTQDELSEAHIGNDKEKDDKGLNGQKVPLKCDK